MLKQRHKAKHHPLHKPLRPNWLMKQKNRKIEETEGAKGRAERKREIAALHKRIEDWNNTHPIGTKVNVEGYEETLETRTRSMVLFGHRTAIYMKDYNGYFALDEVTAVEEGEKPDALRQN